MAIFGRLTDIRKQFNSFKEFVAVFDYLEKAITNKTTVNTRILSMGCDQYKKIEIASDIFAIEQSYYTKKLADSLFESHVKYVDMQFLVSGSEIIEVAHIDTLEIESEYNKEDDYSLYKVTPGSSNITMKKGDLLLLFPEDGHMPGIRINSKSQKVFKTVVKVPVSRF